MCSLDLLLESGFVDGLLLFAKRLAPSLRLHNLCSKSDQELKNHEEWFVSQ